jgi:phosphopantothenoylcysteine decarboxylase/phosphopantothenate--cysteine ligase
MIVANDITREGAGFDTSTNVITLLARGSERPVELPLMSKLEASHHILDYLVRLRRGAMKGINRDTGERMKAEG